MAKNPLHALYEYAVAQGATGIADTIQAKMNHSTHPRLRHKKHKMDPVHTTVGEEQCATGNTMTAAQKRASKAIYPNKKAMWGNKLNRIIVDQLKCSTIVRWNFFNTSANPYIFNTLAGVINHPIMSLHKQYAAADNNSMWMPVFAFNLTSLPYFMDGGTSMCATIPAYRLKKIITASGTADAAQPNYVWTDYSVPAERLVALHDNGTTTTYPWSLQKQIGNTPGTTAPRNHNKYIIDWANAELCFYAPMTTKVNVATVSFNNKMAGPRRQYLKGTTVITYDAEDGTNLGDQDTAKADLWWDHYLSKKTVHPIRSIEPGMKSKSVQFHTNECICIQGGGADAVYKKSMHFPFQQLMTCPNAYGIEGQHRPNINTSVVDTHCIPTWNSFNVANTQSAFPKKEDDVWLLITCNDFEAPAAFTNGAVTTDIHRLHFDIVLTQKTTVSTL